VQAHKDSAWLGIRQGGTVVERRVVIAEARLHHLESLRLERSPYLCRKLQNHFALANALGATRAVVGSAVRRVEHHGIETARARKGRLRRVAYGCCRRSLRRGG